MARASQGKDLRNPDLFKVVWLALVLAWAAATKATCDRVVLPFLCPQAGPTAGPLRVTNNDGTLSNGGKLGGWRYTAYFGAHGSLWLVGGAALSIALMHVWPAKGTQNKELGSKKSAPMDDLA